MIRAAMLMPLLGPLALLALLGALRLLSIQ
jgi:hypothetical protein